MAKGTVPITINDVTLTPLPDVDYPADYWHWLRVIAEKKLPERDVMRCFCQQDLFFLAYFVLGVTDANHPFVIQACKDIQAAPRSNVLYLFAREHFKTTLISKALTLKHIFNNPQERVGIFSYSRPAAKAILRSLKLALETSTFLHWCFPDMLYTDPAAQAPKWSEDDGLIIRRRGYYNEATLEAWGLVESSPTGKHFTHRVYDDVSTEQTVTTPEMMQKVKDMFDLSQNLGTRDGSHVVIGTPYHHEDTLMYVQGKKDREGKPLYVTMRKPATDDGTATGKPVLLSERRLSELMSNRQMFYAQQLLDPTPIADVTLDFRNIREVSHPEIPRNLYRFMTVDPAGQSNYRKGDSWCILVWGVNPTLTDHSASDFYILDAYASPMSDAEAINAIVEMYLRNGRILKIGIEKMALASVELHVANALRTKGKHVSVENDSIQLLRPAGRSKEIRIVQNLQWPLNNGKIHMLRSLPNSFRNALQEEMTKFPFARHDDIIDTMAYAYDMLREYRFAAVRPETQEEKIPWWRKSRNNSRSSWMIN